MLYEFINTFVQNYITPLMEYNIVVYLVLTFIYCLLGGVDEELMALFIIHFIYVIVQVIYQKPLELKHLFKIYVIISFGHLLDLILKLTTSLRNYLILYYTYNSVVDLINIFSSDKKLRLPKQIKDLVKKLRKE